MVQEISEEKLFIKSRQIENGIGGEFSTRPTKNYSPKLDRFKMGLVFQETCCSSQVLKTQRLVQETSKEKLFIKSRQILAIET